MFLCIAKIWFYSIYFLFLLFLSFCSCLRMKEIEIEREWVREKQNTQISKRSFADWCFQDFVFVYTINSIWISLLFSKSILLDFVFLDLLLANLRMLFWFFFCCFVFENVFIYAISILKYLHADSIAVNQIAVTVSFCCRIFHSIHALSVCLSLN